MSGIVVLYIVYAVVLLAGGAMGYAKAKSAPSLVAGVVSAVLALVSAALLHLHHPRSGLGLGVVTSLALAAFFTRRYAATKKAMPSLMITALSVAVLVLSLLRLAVRH